MEAHIYNTEGKKTGTITLPEHLFGVPWNGALMHQVVTSMQDNARRSIAHTKTRSEVRGGGRKPWRQKGTGRARHGSIRSPIWRGGGVTHGPRKEKVFTRNIPKGMRAKALAMALSRKFQDGEVTFVNSFAIPSPKTALAKKMLVSLSGAIGSADLTKKRKSAALIALAESQDAVQKSFRNLGNVALESVRNLTPLSILSHKYLILENPEHAIAVLSARVPARAPREDLSGAKRSKFNTRTSRLVEERGDQ